MRGTRDKPLLGGDATLSDFTAEYPSMGLALSEGKGRFDALPDGSAKITASAKSGPGTLTVDGGLSWFGTSTPLLLNIRGDNVLAYNTSELRIIANPDMQFGITDNTMHLRGKVTVPEADIDLERLDRGTSVSEDVVVLDPVDPEQTPASPLDIGRLGSCDLAIVRAPARPGVSEHRPALRPRADRNRRCRNPKRSPLRSDETSRSAPLRRHCRPAAA